MANSIAVPSKGSEPGRRAPGSLPRICIVTPSFNQATFLERTILSVLGQAYPNLEYVVVDGGSTDGSVEIIKRYERHLSRWVSEPDRGQSDAVNKGFAGSTADIFGWQNSDDVYLPGAFRAAAAAMEANPSAGIVFGNTRIIDEQDRTIGEQRYAPLWRPGLLAEGMLLHNTAAFWRRSTWEAVGGLDLAYRFAMDYDFFLRATAVTRAKYVHEWLGCFRRHSETKTTSMGATVGRKESQRARRAAMPWTAIYPLLGQAALGVFRPVSIAHRTLWYLLQGDLGYLLRGARRRLVPGWLAKRPP